jgi:exosortase
MRRNEWILALGLAAVFAPAVFQLAGVWSSVEYYSHGFLVPVASGLVAHGIARSRTALPRTSDWRGAVALGAALLAQAAGVLSGSVALQGLALVGALTGAVWALRGTQWLRALAFPLGFLLFMVPIPPTWLAPVVVQLLLFVTSAATRVLHFFGMPVLREGNVIELPSGESLFVAEACSGLTSLVTLLPIAVLIAWLAPVAMRWKIALVVLSVPIAMFANLLRVIGTSMGAVRWGVGIVTAEPAHTLIGLGVYAIACVALLALVRSMPRARKARSARTA